eukprot:Polyplicarium_translucidae@DN190_c0_g1_i1.p1
MLWIMSPVLRNLTASYSDDTVLALSAFLIALHLLLTDYGFVHRNDSAEMPLGGFSINAAMCSAALLSSRLPASADSSDIFAFCALGILTFAISPSLRRDIRVLNEAAYVLHLTPLLVACAAAAVGSLDKRACAAFSLCVLGISFLLPYCFVKLRLLKLELRGPWDLPNVDRKGY